MYGFYDFNSLPIQNPFLNNYQPPPPQVIQPTNQQQYGGYMGQAQQLSNGYQTGKGGRYGSPAYGRGQHIGNPFRGSAGSVGGGGLPAGPHLGQRCGV